MYTALQAMTIWAAIQYFEDKQKCSLAVGKLADFVVLNANPLSVAPSTLKDIQVLETIEAGKSVFLAQ